jgi:hypothetical protein
MADTIELPPADDQSSSDEETVKGDRESIHVADVLEEDRTSSTTPVPPIGGSSITNRYRELLEVAYDDSSEDGSTSGGIPRRGGSPIDSLLSIPDDSPSIQVCSSALGMPGLS